VGQTGISVVAAGKFQFDAAKKLVPPTYAFSSLSSDNSLTVTPFGTNLFLLEGGFQPNGNYIVKGTPIATVANSAVSQTFEVISPNDPDLATLLPAGKTTSSGLVVRVMQVGNPAASVATGFMVEISQIA
jgi:hypothetical protein